MPHILGQLAVRGRRGNQDVEGRLPEEFPDPDRGDAPPPARPPLDREVAAGPGPPAGASSG